MKNNLNIVEKIKKFVEDECKKPEACFKGAYERHFVPVRNYAVKLARELGADVEIVEIAAWLHDIASIKGNYKNHHLVGAEIAKKKLKEFYYPEEKIEIIKKCILNHRGSVNNLKESLEEKIIAEADTMSHFDDVDGLLIQWGYKDFIKEKLKRSYLKLSFQESRDLIKPKYEAAMLLLK